MVPDGTYLVLISAVFTLELVDDLFDVLDALRDGGRLGFGFLGGDVARQQQVAAVGHGVDARGIAQFLRDLALRLEGHVLVFKLDA
ncbi:hypothetical protein G6F60_015254 [Rhizopus arrhizus]|nr:hypothetical protein G6F60_015254 [Rhizopus arrhizus]